MVQHDQFAGLRIHAGGHQLGSSGNDRIFRFRENEVVQLHFSFFIVAGDPHDVFGVHGNQVGVFVNQCLAHPLGVVDVFAKHNRFIKAVGQLQIGRNPLGNQLGPFLQHQGFVKILLIVDPVFDLQAMLVDHTALRSPAGQVFVHIDAHHFVWRQKTIVNALPERIGVDRRAKVVDIGDIFGFFGRRRQADLRRCAEVFENLPPVRIFRRTAAMALVDHDQVKKLRCELFVDILLLFGPGYSLIKRQIDLIRFVGLPVVDLGHGGAEGFKIIGHGLINQNVAVG